MREARVGDAPGIAAVFTAAARAAWSDFLGVEAMNSVLSPPGRWRERLRSLPPGAVFLVALDRLGVCAFALVVPEAAGSPATGELDLFYAHPRVWGTGIAQSLHDRAMGVLAAAGCSDASLWTEERNARARRFYHRSGWQPDGVVRERRFLDVPIRELRLRLHLADRASERSATHGS